MVKQDEPEDRVLHLKFLWMPRDLTLYDEREPKKIQNLRLSTRFLKELVKEIEKVEALEEKEKVVPPFEKNTTGVGKEPTPQFSMNTGTKSDWTERMVGVGQAERDEAEARHKLIQQHWEGLMKNLPSNIIIGQVASPLHETLHVYVLQPSPF